MSFDVSVFFHRTAAHFLRGAASLSWRASRCHRRAAFLSGLASSQSRPRSSCRGTRSSEPRDIYKVCRPAASGPLPPSPGGRGASFTRGGPSSLRGRPSFLPRGPATSRRGLASASRGGSSSPGTAALRPGVSASPPGTRSFPPLTRSSVRRGHQRPLLETSVLPGGRSGRASWPAWNARAGRAPADILHADNELRRTNSGLGASPKLWHDLRDCPRHERLGNDRS